MTSQLRIVCHDSDRETNDRKSDHPWGGTSSDENLTAVANEFSKFMNAIGLDGSDPHLRGTEWRVARMYRELFAGLDPANEPVLTTFPNTNGYNNVIRVADVQFYSMCAHHFLPFHGVACIEYVPRAKLVGLSKLARAVEFFARRPQIQERLTQQVADFLDVRLDAAGVRVTIDARHMCMEMRGVQQPGALTTTTAVRGVFENASWNERTNGSHSRRSMPHAESEQ